MNRKELMVVDALRRDSRATLTKIAEKTGLPLSTVFKKVVRLEKQGLITRYFALLDFSRLGYPFRAIVFVRTS